MLFQELLLKQVVGIVWLEVEFDLVIDDEDMTLEKLGSINQITSYINAHRVT